MSWRAERVGVTSNFHFFKNALLGKPFFSFPRVPVAVGRFSSAFVFTYGETVAADRLAARSFIYLSFSPGNDCTAAIVRVIVKTYLLGNGTGTTVHTHGKTKRRSNRNFKRPFVDRLIPWSGNRIRSSSSAARMGDELTYSHTCCRAYV